MNNYKIKFISQKDFEKHVKNTLLEYKKHLTSYSLKEFNRNIIDPIKFTFDMIMLNKTCEELIDMEIQRQRDKANNNSIEYFHQKIFKYIKNCQVPDNGWDIIFHGEENCYYVEMKNKHNTMNSSSASKTYLNMYNEVVKNINSHNIYFLTEVISKQSQNKPWKITIDGEKYLNNNIRKISIDKFYEIVTGEEDAFYQICEQLPITISKLVSEDPNLISEQDTVISELKKKHTDILKAIYGYAFSSYNGFKKK